MLNYWEIKKTHSKEAYNDSDSYTLFNGAERLMQVYSAHDMLQLQIIADSHNKTIMELYESVLSEQED